jgi:hypothetical protein
MSSRGMYRRNALGFMVRLIETPVSRVNVCSI